MGLLIDNDFAVFFVNLKEHVLYSILCIFVGYFLVFILLKKCKAKVNFLTFC